MPMFGVLDVLFGWMPPICGTLAFSATVIFVAMFIFGLIKAVKDIIPFV